MHRNVDDISSRMNQYPHPQKEITREIHGPCRGHNLGFNGNCSRSNINNRVCENEGSFDKVGDELYLKFERVGKIAVKSLRYINKNEDVVIDVDKEADVDGEEFVANGCETGEMALRVEENGKKWGSHNLLVSSVQNQLARFRLGHSVKEPDEKGVSEDLRRKPFTPLTHEEKHELYQALLLQNRKKVLVTHERSNIEITGELLQCLKLGQWLNDEVINVYLELLKEREKRDPQRSLKCHFFNTFFYKKLIGGKSGYDYKSVRRWTTQKKLGYSLYECDKIFVPIHKQAHWCLAVINKKDKKFQYLDSLRGIDAKVLRVLAMYYVDEVKDKSGVDIDVDTWSQENVKDIPVQKNGSDCGMFMIKYVDFYSRGLGLFFNQDHMPYFRSRTTKEILRLEAE